MSSWKTIVDKYYPEGSRLRDIYLRHSRSVADLALAINEAKALGLDPARVEEAAMLHDVGIFLTRAEALDCHGDAPYIAHGYLGADLLRAEGYPEEDARVAERHTGTGLTFAEAFRLGLPEDRNYMPETELERLVAYADKFYSKSGDMERKSLAQVRRSLGRHGSDTLARFERLHSRYSLADE